MATLEERYQSSFPILARLGRANAEGVPLGSEVIEKVSPDLYRIIGEACFGYLWNQPNLTFEQRSLATISALVALRRDNNLRGHLLSGLDVGFSPAQLSEIMLQVHFYVGAPMSTTAIGVLLDVCGERGVEVDPIKVFDTTEDPESLYQRGLATRREIMGDSVEPDLANGDEVDRAWDRYEVEYLWGSVWPRPGLTRQQRVLCTLTALMVVGRERPIADYMRAAQNVGFTKAQIKDLILQLTFYIGVGEARALRAVAEEVFASG